MIETQGVSLQLTDIENPSHLDVLCGRGVGTNRHSGNEYYRNLVMSKEGLYAKSTKTEKMVITRSIVQIVRECGGRFLDKNPFTGLWYDVGDKKAIEKTSQALRDGPATRKKDGLVYDSPRSMSGIEPSHSFTDCYDSGVYAVFNQKEQHHHHKQPSPQVILSSDIHLSPKQTFQQHFDSVDETVHSPKMRKLQPRPMHRRVHTAGETHERDFNKPTELWTKSKVVLNIFRSKDESDDVPSISTSCKYDANTEYPSPRTYWVQYSSSQHAPIFRTYSEPMERGSISPHLQFPSLDQMSPGPLILSFSGEKEIDVEVTGYEDSSDRLNSMVRDIILESRSFDSYESSIYKTMNHKPKLVPFDWSSSPVITKMTTRENMDTVTEALPYFPRVPSWSNLVTPEKKEDSDPYPYDDRFDAFQINLETVQSFLESEHETDDPVDVKLEESTIMTDPLPFSIPDIIDSNRRANGGNVSALTTPNCESPDGDIFDSSSCATLRC